MLLLFGVLPFPFIIQLRTSTVILMPHVGTYRVIKI